jgi:DNA-binding transcriptional MerR regulator
MTEQPENQDGTAGEAGASRASEPLFPWEGGGTGEGGDAAAAGSGDVASDPAAGPAAASTDEPTPTPAASADEPDAAAARSSDESNAAATRSERAELLEAGARVLARERPVAPREYYSISEVCELVELKPHVLRYWESQFVELNPSKNRAGNRVYQRKEIRLILLVKTLLYEEKYTVDGARAKLEQMRKGGELTAATGRALDRHMLQVLRTDLQQLAGLLAPPRS